MHKRRFLQALFGRILTPSYISTVLWLITDTVEVFVLGIALSVVLAVAAPLLETGAELLGELRVQRQAGRREELLDTFTTFINAYKDILTKYPPALYPEPQAHSATEQIARLARHLHTLKGLRTRHHPTPYDVVQALVFAPEDFSDWDLLACEEFVQQVLEDLLDVATVPLQRAVQRFVRQRTVQAWKASLGAAERELDRQAQHQIGQWRLLQQAREDPELRQQLTTLLHSGAFHRQASLQAYLTSRQQLPANEMHAAIASLRYEAVAEAALAALSAAHG